jgi:Rps23 Pro-64 3,4-dihydroxylase Tpa1-like proline 4-hydroxylase
MSSPIRPFDVEDLGRRYHDAKPFPFIAIDDFLEEDFAREVLAAYPTFEAAQAVGREFQTVNEKLKVQVCDTENFAPSVARLNDAIASPEFLGDLTTITGIRNLQADPQLRGGGMHLTNTSGRLDVHVDFNLIDEEQLHRRLNILIYFNPTWDPRWGGQVELWDRDVTTCEQSFDPILNRCVIFETSEVSYHGVAPVVCPPGESRKSFAAYYYTEEAPAGWTGKSHSTIFRARPDEVLRGKVLMPAERVGQSLLGAVRSIRRKLRETVRPSSD